LSAKPQSIKEVYKQIQLILTYIRAKEPLGCQVLLQHSYKVNKQSTRSVAPTGIGYAPPSPLSASAETSTVHLCRQLSRSGRHLYAQVHTAKKFATMFHNAPVSGQGCSVKMQSAKEAVLLG